MLRFALAALALLGALAVAAVAGQEPKAPAAGDDPVAAAGAIETRVDIQGVGPSTLADSSPTTAPRFIRAQRPGHVMARRLIGRSVLSRVGRPIGRVKDLIVDREGRIEGVVVTFGGIFGLGEKQVAVALDGADAVSLRTIADDVIPTGLTASDLKDAPAFRGARDRGVKG